MATFTDQGYYGTGSAISMPSYDRNLLVPMRAYTTSHHKILTIGEHTIATLKTRRLLAKLRCARIKPPFDRTILVLQLVEGRR